MRARNLLDTARLVRRRLARSTQVRIHGEIDADNADRVAHLLTASLKHTKGPLDIDLAAVPRLSHSGAGAFVDTLRAAHTAGIPVTVRNANPQVREALHSLGLERMLTFTDDTPAP
ncbi:STAS domain-containing protein [Kitasatospora purpeofusca]|uniref:STAS domain-containing protein n=1 Tax=Kitasatospora purpeofusca TaxID=67352 RepID=UPI002257A3E3|nr:STAS domain-containing protein [Kitasatospora purpeofusca]MCX4758624.1 STAS domain-containing protein [Kitasatospora purpeofusca]WSR30940.1 STAS domain-containing protein [Kitasatospora purpeofusca]